MHPVLRVRGFPAAAWQAAEAAASELRLEYSKERFQTDSLASAWRVESAPEESAPLGAETPEVVGQPVVRVVKELRGPELLRKDAEMAHPGFLACKTSSKAGSFPLCASEET